MLKMSHDVHFWFSTIVIRIILWVPRFTETQHNNSKLFFVSNSLSFITLQVFITLGNVLTSLGGSGPIRHRNKSFLWWFRQSFLSWTRRWRNIGAMYFHNIARLALLYWRNSANICFITCQYCCTCTYFSFLKPSHEPQTIFYRNYTSQFSSLNTYFSFLLACLDNHDTFLNWIAFKSILAQHWYNIGFLNDVGIAMLTPNYSKFQSGNAVWAEHCDI